MSFARRYGIALILALVAALPVRLALAQSGVTKDAITLGQSGALTGPLAELNREYLSGAVLHFDQLNRQGGIHGRRIQLVSLDDAYDPEKAAVNARALIDRTGVLALFACFGTGPSQKMIPVAAEARVPFFAPYTGADGLRSSLNPFVFHLRASYGREIETMVDHLTRLGVTSIGVVHHSDPFGEAGLAAAKKALAARGLTPSVIAPIASSGANATETVARLASANPAAVLLVTAGNSSAAFLRALHAGTVRPMLYGLSVISSRQLIRELGTQAHGLVIAQVVPSPFRVDYPVVREYRQAADKAGQEYSYTALEGYLAARAFAEGLRRAGREPTRERLMAALETLGQWDGGGLPVAFSADRRVGLDFVDLAVISRGQFAP